jgi:hypothetical protein
MAFAEGDGGAMLATGHLQNISTVLRNVHPCAESLMPSFITTDMTAVSLLVSNEATQLKFEVQILSERFVNTIASTVWIDLPEAYFVFRDDGPTAHLTVALLCDDRDSAFGMWDFDREKTSVSDVLDDPKAVSVLREHPLEYSEEVSSEEIRGRY